MLHAVRCLLHAAALGRRDPTDLYRWSLSPVAARDAVEILQSHPNAATAWARALDAIINADPRQRDSTWAMVANTFACLADPRVLASVSPSGREQFRPDEFLRRSGTVYLLGTAAGASATAGLVMSDHELREQVRSRYVAAATAVTGSGGPALTVLDTSGSCCTPAGEIAGAQASCCGGEAAEVDAAFGSGRYTAGEQDELPAEAVLASLGCGNPVAVADLRAGDRVLDLGSGGGIDVLLSARRVGPTGRAFGVDMTDEMLDLARTNAARAGATNVEFRKGTIEAIPLPAGSIDVVISNCVINLSADKPAVLAEMFRVLAPGGRIGLSDVVAEDHLTAQDRAERGSHVGCIAGALSRSEYLDGLAAAGFTDAEVSFTHEAAPGMHAAIIRAVKPA